MHFRRIIFAAAALLAALQAPLAGIAADDRPNVVLILSDDQAWSDYGFMGHPTIKTPHLDKLSSESATFVNGYVPTSLCRPSLATLISGLYPHQTKITGNDPPKGTNRREMLKHVRTMPKLPAILGDAGYVSFQAGKWWEGNFAEGGFTAGMTHGDPTKGGRHGDDGLKIGRDGLDAVWTFLDESKGKPFLSVVRTNSAASAAQSARAALDQVRIARPTDRAFEILRQLRMVR